MVINVLIKFNIMSNEIISTLPVYLTLGSVMYENLDTVIYSGFYYSTKCIIKKIVMDPKIGIKPKVIREISVLRNVKSDYIVKMYGVYYDNDNVYIVLENGCENILDIDKKELSDENIIKNVVSGLKALVDNNYIHGDLSFKNIVRFKDELTDKYTYKIIDFGSSTKNYRRSTIMKPTLYIMPNEFNEPNKIKMSKIDSWALGCLHYYIFNGTIPVKCNNKKKQKRNMYLGLIHDNTNKRHGINVVYKKLFKTNQHVKNNQKSEILCSEGNIVSEKSRHNIIKLLLTINIQNNIPIENIFLTVKLLLKLKNSNDNIGNSLLLYFLTTKLVSNITISTEDITNIINVYAPTFLKKDVNSHMFEILNELNWDIDIKTLISYTSNVAKRYSIKYLLISFVTLCYPQYDIFDTKFLHDTILLLIKCSSNNKIDKKIDNKYQTYYAASSIAESIKNIQTDKNVLHDIFNKYCESIGYTNFNNIIDFKKCFSLLV